jgi:5,10-methylenetetrahydromethanopterin reductase
MKFGAGFLGHLSKRVDTQRLVGAAQLCERSGLDSFWVADQRFMRDAFISLATIAANTSRLLLGTRVTDPYIRHPALTAIAAATLNEASSGRAVLGLGAGGSGFSQLGLSRERPALALREAIDLMRMLWRGGPVEYEGTTVHWGTGEIQFPLRPNIPIVIAARGPKLLELAGEMADGVIIATGVSRQSVTWARERIEAGETRAGKRKGSTELLHMTYVAIDKDRATARQAAKKAIVGAVVGSHPTYEFLKINGLEVPTELYSYLDAHHSDAAEIIRMIPDEFVGKLTIAGTLDDCLTQLAELVSLGIEHPLLTPVPAAEGGEFTILDSCVRTLVPGVRSLQPTLSDRR